MFAQSTRWSILLVVGSIGCVGSDGSSNVTVSDSAGIVISESAAPAWTPGDEWSIRPEPDLVIGSPDGDAPDVFGTISDVEVLPDGLAVIDGQAREVRIFASDGGFRLSLGGPGDGPGEFRAPSLLRLTDRGELFVYDRQLGRASWFQPSSGDLLRTLSLAGVKIGGIGRLREVLPLSGGSLAGREGNDLSQGQGPGTSRDTSHFAVVSTESLEVSVVASVPGVWTIRFTHQGNPGFRHQPLTTWPSWDVAGDTLYITSGEQFSVRKVTSSGPTAVFRRSGTPSLVEEHHVAAFRAETLAPIPPEQRSQVEPLLDLFEYPERVPAYSKLLVDPERFIWVEHPGLVGRSPGPSWDVYSPTGEYLGAVTTPEGAELMRIDTDHVLAVWRDELDVPYLHRYPLLRDK